MTGLEIVSLDSLLTNLEENTVNNILAGFSCPVNADVEEFLHVKAIQFNKQGISKTFLVVTSFKGKAVIAGYFTISTKVITVQKNRLSKSFIKRINKFAKYDTESKSYIMPCPLLGQFALNFAYGKKLISGSDLMKIALGKVKELHQIGGGKTLYLECEDKIKLVKFYEQFNFREFDRRKLDEDELNQFKGTELIQMIAYIS